MTMKKSIFLAALVVAMSAVSCVEDINNDAPTTNDAPTINDVPTVNDGAVIFEASFGAISKAVLEPGREESKVAWEAGDQVSVLADEGNYLYTAASAGYSTTLSTEATDVPSGAEFYAVYPYDADAALAKGVITTVLPDEQTAVLGSFSTHLAVAKASGNQFAFKNVCGLVKIKVSDPGVTKVELKGNNGEIVAGGIEVTVADEPTWEATENGTKTVSLVAEEGDLAEGVYYFAVLPQTFDEGFTVTAYKGENAWDVRNVSSSVTIARCGIIGSNSFGVEGTGTEADPYILDCAQDLVEMRNLAPVGGETWFKMTKNIDLKGINWVPVNNDEDFERKIHFDGNGKTISNLSCNSNSYSGYPSFFGVLYGSCKNLKFDNATITGTGTSGVIGGYVGTTDKPALVENVTITNSTVESSGDRAGGVAGDAKEATFKNVSFQGTVESKKTDDEDGAHSGGFVGKTETTAVFENCSVEATVKGQAINLGGFVGKVTGEIKCTGCSVKASVNSSQHYAGGFVGYMGDATDVTITGCHFSGTVTGKSSVAGLVSAVETGGKLTLKNSYVQGEVTPSGTKGGGLIGGVSGTADVENCWADVTLNMPNNQFGGGVVGGAPGAITIRNCFMTGLINVGRGCGCIAGQLKGSSPTVEGCIAWGDITTNRSATQYSPGAVVGNIQVNGNFKNCWRNPAMVLTDDYMKLVDHENVENGRPALPDYTTTDQNQYAYHGMAAAEGATISSVAKELGWDEDIWDLSGDVPALK